MALSKGWASKANWVMLIATAMGGRIDGKEQGKAQTGTQACSEAPGPGAIEVSRIEQPDIW